MVSGLGTDSVVEQTATISAIDDVPLANPAAVLFAVADEYVGSWMATLMSWLVLSSLFAGLLAFQNSAARYFYSLGRAGVLPRGLDRVNGRGAPVAGAMTTSLIGLAVILYFELTDKDPVLNLFFWFSGLAVLAIVLVEVLVSIAVIAYFRRTGEDRRPWNTLVAPILAIVGLIVGAYLITARFGLLAGTVAEGVDPTAQTFGLSSTGWTLVLLPYAVFVIGMVIGQLRRNKENQDAVADLVS
jgi:amino acid transporter